jgi:hypothetical protein
MNEPQFHSDILKRTSTMAIVSLLGGISFFVGVPIIGSVIAVITGNMAIKEIRSSGGMVTGENLAKIGLITGWFGLGVWILGIVCAVLGLLPVIASVCVAAFPFLTELLKSFHQ